MKNTWDNVNWEEQWKLHAPTFLDGKAIIDLSQFGGTGQFSLFPGPGFGDLSHPTTNLMLSSMVKLQQQIEGSYVIDIGSGSGILSFAAKLLGAKEVYGVEIDETAILHARENAKKNNLEVTFTKYLFENKAIQELLQNLSLGSKLDTNAPCTSISRSSSNSKSNSHSDSNFKSNSNNKNKNKNIIILMNMISSEQEAIWEDLPVLPSITYVLSGVLAEQKNDYIKKFSKRELITELELNDWISFTF